VSMLTYIIYGAGCDPYQARLTARLPCFGRQLTEAKGLWDRDREESDLPDLPTCCSRHMRKSHVRPGQGPVLFICSNARFQAHSASITPECAQPASNDGCQQFPSVKMGREVADD
jgi:hypothetical protein